MDDPIRDIVPLAEADHDLSTYSAIDTEASTSTPLGANRTGMDSFPLSLVSAYTLPDARDPLNFGEASPEFSMTQSDVPAMVPNHNVERVTKDQGLSPDWRLSRPAAASPYSDYAINLPGLSVICAKVDIFNSIVGAGCSLDIWDPRALSPICLGVVTRPCPANFMPTYLQRNIPHHSIIDTLPWPSFRDRFLYTMSLPKALRPRVAQQDMPSVTLEIMMAAKDVGEGIRVRGSNPYLAENWEVGQTFYSKFWWAIDPSIIYSSNRQRERRGEGPLRHDFLRGA